MEGRLPELELELPRLGPPDAVLARLGAEVGSNTDLASLVVGIDSAERDHQGTHCAVAEHLRDYKDLLRYDMGKALTFGLLD